MKFENHIISASAGTGKTYRLSLEYISLILKYYGDHPEFSLDSVLVITFTRKATAEIRDRINTHMKSLVQKTDEGLLISIRKHVPSKTLALSPKEEGKLLSALAEIQADQRKLQVMTIDSYVGSIFRNIVRPLRSIDSYSLDPGAAKKRMPLLMNHLMHPDFRDRVDKLLSRSVKRSLDDYTKFFSSLINERWIYYQTTSCTNYDPNQNLRPQYDFEQEFLSLAQAIGEICQSKGKSAYSDYFKKGFVDLFAQQTEDPKQLLDMTLQLLSRSAEAMALLDVLNKDLIFNKNKIPKTEHDALAAQQDIVLKALGERLFRDYFLPEQAEILEIWKIILEEYDRLIYRYKNMSYQDITWFTFEALFSPDPPIFNLEDAIDATEFYAFLSHRSRFVLIDEFQDTSLLQFKILLPIMEEVSSGVGSKEIGGVVVVGDEKQSIFGWRGGERDLLLNLQSIIPSLGEIPLDHLVESWRVGEDMMDFINSIFSDSALHSYLENNGMDWPYPLGRSALGELSCSLEYKCTGYNAQKGQKKNIYRDFVEGMILPAIEADESIAILCRTNNQLQELQLILEEHSKNPVYQPNAPITEHRLVAPLINWLRFVCYGDWMDWLAFLRSDYILLPATDLKQLVDYIGSYESGIKADDNLAAFDYPESETLMEFYRLAREQATMSPYEALLMILDACPILPEDTPQRDYLNLQSFLSIAREWELCAAEAELSIADFLAYMEENLSSEGFTQVSVESSTGIQLLSIHKSKGLQFERVFVLYDVSSSSRRPDTLFSALRYTDKTFKEIAQYAFSYHYEKILPYSPLAELYQQSQTSDLLEELNTLYVAFTRAEKSLHIYFAYNSSKSWDEYYAEKQSSGKVSLPMLIADSCDRYFAEIPPGESGSRMIRSSYPAKKSDHGPEESDDRPNPALKIAGSKSWDWASYLEQDIPQGISYKDLYLEKRQALWGDIAHFYLSFILRDTPDEHSRARIQSINRYGSLVPMRKLESLFFTLKAALVQHSYLFSEEYDKIFCEIDVANYRVDRLMLNTDAREALIVDYKTGSIHEKDQLQLYEEALKKLPILMDYSFERRFVMLDLDSFPS